jgi:hypothetical protein
MIITINTDAISDAQKATEQFKSAYKEMLAMLSAPGFIPVLCAHEAAHVIYFNLLGARTFEPLPSKIWYNPAIADYEGILAAVQFLDQDMPMWTVGHFWEWIPRVACAHAAGGVVARKKMPSSDGGDKNDKERFRNLCKVITDNSPNVKIDVEELWNQALKQVAADLENPQNMALVDEWALKLQPELGFR